MTENELTPTDPLVPPVQDGSPVRPVQTGEILIYQTGDGQVKLDVRLEDETVWLTQEHMARLFGKGRTTITEHIGNVFKGGELNENVVCRNFRHTTQHGAIEGKTQSRDVRYYSLDVIISVGHRVKSRQGTQFRILDKILYDNFRHVGLCQHGLAEAVKYER